MASTSNQPVNPDTPPVNTDAPPVNHDPPQVKEKMYYTRPIKFLGRKTQIIMQEKNGPCALISICNILLLRNKFNLRLGEREVSESRLIMLVAERLIEQHKDAGSPADQLQVIAKAADLLPSFARGMNVNVKFDSMYGFESTKELAVFRLLGIPIVHGWLANPQDPEIFNAFGSKSYYTVQYELVVLQTKNKNALRVINSFKHNVVSEPLKYVTGGITAKEGKLITDFLKDNSTELTRYGLFKLQYTLTEPELCVFYRNGHLNTMCKFAGDLYILVTDEGYIDIPGVVWEKLNEINGDTMFVDEDFQIYKPQICESEIQEIQDDKPDHFAKVFEYMIKHNKRAGQEDPTLKYDIDLEHAKALQEREYQRIIVGQKKKQQYKEQNYGELACGSRPVSPENFLSGFNVSPKANFLVWPKNRSSAMNRKQSKKSAKGKLKEKCNMM